MKRNIKILSILVILLLFVSTISLATDINMNLQPGNSVNANDTSLNSENTNVFSNTTQNTFEDDDFNEASQSTSITSSSSVEDESLGITNILNILLIVVGVVLILLGIAILIRMHS